MELHLVVFRLGPCLMGSHRVPATHTFYSRKDIATPGNLHPQASTAVTHCLLIATQFIDPRKNDNLCQAQECHRELNTGRWRHRRVCYHTVTCYIDCIHGNRTHTGSERWVRVKATHGGCRRRLMLCFVMVFRPSLHIHTHTNV